MHAAGFGVTTENGSLRVKKGDHDLSIRADGGIWSGQVLLDKLKLVEIDSSKNLRPEGLNMYSSIGNEPRVVAAKLMAGSLESSNTSGHREMMQIMEMARTYELVVRLMRSEGSPDELQRLSAQI